MNRFKLNRNDVDERKKHTHMKTQSKEEKETSTLQTTTLNGTHKGNKANHNQKKNILSCAVCKRFVSTYTDSQFLSKYNGFKSKS